MLYILKRRTPVWGELDMLVVRASSEQEAREVGGRELWERCPGRQSWSAEYATCEPLEPEGPTDVILRRWMKP